MGFMGFYSLFMILKKEEEEGGNVLDSTNDRCYAESMTLENMPEMQWGDRLSR